MNELSTKLRRKHVIVLLLTDEEWGRINRFMERTGLKKQFFFHEAIMKEIARRERQE